MATIKFSAIVSSITGKMHGDVLRRGRGGTTLMAGYKPKSSASSAQHTHRGRVSDKASEWFALSDSAKLLWHKYASLLSRPMSGQDAYVMLNVRLASADHDDLTAIGTPPATPSTPEHVGGFAVSVI